jgi:hypothetical protein
MPSKPERVETEDEIEDDDDESEEKTGDEEEDSESKDEIPNLLKELNETAIFALNNDDNDNSLECLKRAEQLLEVITSEGKDVDRNMIIVVLYNMACCY